MKKEDADLLIRCVKECWWRMALVLAIPLGIMAWVFWGSPVTVALEDGAAAWVQAFGSIGAVVAAIYVLHKQRQDMIEREVNAIRTAEARLLMALKTEISIRQGQYMEKIGNLIADGSIRSIGAFEWAAPDNPFHIYTAMCKDLGLVKEDELRALVIKTYAEMEGLIYSIKTMKDELAKVAEQNLWSRPHVRQCLEENYKMVEDHHALAEQLVHSLLHEIDTYLSGQN
ncbi:hypothetical protein [Alcaligenes faecalis]|uniref:hypothetical protein n=1 Tax=Alcaligenes faecalis TaxID=511 RepID=UPI001EF07DE8|nr:hypothetical protein [Alcaligenes faecalis]ULH05369.1 hypothetical protein MF263_11765 [Alcaligenes faecalis]